ncbi:MAG: hypothetical protein IJH64_00440 [Oscillospiraceae bacterium]|nr:hypothetical protein [Oscillospiraceae bacterium]
MSKTAEAMARYRAGKASASGAGSSTAQISMQNLPALEGTERQIAYAEQLRQREIPRINAEIQSLTAMPDTEFIKRANSVWLENMGLGIKSSDGNEIIKSKSITKAVADYDNAVREAFPKIRSEMGLRRSEALELARTRLAPKYRKEIEKAIDFDGITKSIESKTSAAWWIEKSRAVKF